MKIYRLTAALLLIVIVTLSCSKDIEGAIDCATEGILLDVEHAADAQNVKLINFTLHYSGEKTLNNSVSWNFGDGQVQTFTGLTASHTYTAAGTFIAKATVKFNGGSCSVDVRETVSVQ